MLRSQFGHFIHTTTADIALNLGYVSQYQYEQAIFDLIGNGGDYDDDDMAGRSRDPASAKLTTMSMHVF